MIAETLHLGPREQESLTWAEFDDAVHYLAKRLGKQNGPNWPPA